MGTIQYSDNRDRKTFSDASLTIEKFIIGKNNKQGLDNLKKLLLKHLQSVTFTPFSDRPMNNLGNTSVIGKIKIDSVGHDGTNSIEEEKKVRHAITHELMHAYVLAIQKENPKSYHKNEKNYIGLGGYICNADDIKANEIKTVYGLYLMEALTELLTNVARSSFDEQYKAENSNIDANTILKTSYNGLNIAYNEYVPMAKLMVEVFSNWDKADYAKFMKESDSQGICSLKIKTDTNKIIQSNDLLYGYMYDPIYPLEKYDEIMGNGSYINLLKKFDNIKTNNQINKNIVEDILRSLSKFTIDKLLTLVKNGILSIEEATQLLDNNNEMFKITKEQYGIDIDIAQER
jgi:hypothetical protein